MAEKTTKSEKPEKGDFTTRDMEIMAKAWTCMEEAPKIDFNKLAEAVGMSNPRSASNAWANIKKKIMAKGGVSGEEKEGEDGETGENGEATPKAKAKATPKRKKATTATTGPDDEEASPTKKPKATPKTPRSKAKKSKDKADSEEDAPVKEEEAEEDGAREE